MTMVGHCCHRSFVLDRVQMLSSCCLRSTKLILTHRITWAAHHCHLLLNMNRMRRLLSCYFRIPKSILWHRIAEVAHHCHMLFVLGLIMESRRVDPNSRGNSGRTPLSYAAQYGHRHAMKLLLNTSKVDVDSEDNIGRTPLSDAAQYGKQEVIPLLLHTDKVDIDSVDNNNMTPLKYAEKSGIPRLSICCLKFAKLYRIHHSCSMKWVVTCQKTKSIICWFNR
ncbi:hypothetical protein BDBG_17836 [Blastomyces gilchristii SLH14081]|uniref:Uncharacterized protein n=1 Tax=Blastomyces gilchristii (strain SLH14081) TaxID=559298 RepID=A0A179UZL7_BLAGS|nr:uncharacterized protein BDBG_17836 [Blastomyces gilchristii SLH14081]OAT13524.1 hypothetical protein BDBG_17836 [Blastomyces gilchristii SLH14081]